MQAICPECEGNVSLPNDAFRGEFVTCPDCGVGLELIKVDPPTCEMVNPDEDDFGE